MGEKTAGSQLGTWLGAAHALPGRAAGGGWLPLQASRGGERGARGQEAGGARSLRPSSPLGGRAASVVPPPLNRRWAVAMQQAVLLSGAQRTTNRGQRTDGAYWWGCLGLPPPLRSAFLPLSYPPPSLHPVLALRNLSLHNAFPSHAHAGRGVGGGGRSWHKQRRCRPQLPPPGAIRGLFCGFPGGGTPSPPLHCSGVGVGAMCVGRCGWLWQVRRTGRIQGEIAQMG